MNPLSGLGACESHASQRGTSASSASVTMGTSIKWQQRAQQVSFVERVKNKVERATETILNAVNEDPQAGKFAHPFYYYELERGCRVVIFKDQMHVYGVLLFELDGADGAEEAGTGEAEQAERALRALSIVHAKCWRPPGRTDVPPVDMVGRLPTLGTLYACWNTNHAHYLNICPGHISVTFEYMNAVVRIYAGALRLQDAKLLRALFKLAPAASVGVASSAGSGGSGAV